MMQRVAFVLALLLLPTSLVAQWLDFRTPWNSANRRRETEPEAPAPRTPDGKPDFSGTWQPETNPYRFDLIEDSKDERVFRPAAEALFLKRVGDFRRDDPVTNCLPGGPSDMLAGSYRIVQSAGVIALLYEKPLGVTARSTWTDARCRPIRTQHGWGTRLAVGRAIRWSSNLPASMIAAGSIVLATRTPRRCASLKRLAAC